jgi:hypothetical protein
MKFLLPFVFYSIFASTVHGQIVLSSLGNPVSQSFDSLASSPVNQDLPFQSNVTITGVYLSRSTYWVGSGTATAGTVFSFGISTNSSERALGSLAVNSTGTIYYGIRLRNDTGQTVTSLDVSYVGEQWRKANNSAVQKLAFEYRQGVDLIDLTGTYTPLPALDFASPIFSATTGTALDGNLAANRTLTSATLNVTIPPGEEVMLRWADANDPNEDHGLAVDDVTIIPRGIIVPFDASISGRLVSFDGRGLPFSRVVIEGGELTSPKFAMTNAFGIYRFTGLPTGQTYQITATSKRAVFTEPTRSLTLTGNITNFDFIEDL